VIAFETFVCFVRSKFFSHLPSRTRRRTIHEHSLTSPTLKLHYFLFITYCHTHTTGPFVASVRFSTYSSTYPAGQKRRSEWDTTWRGEPHRFTHLLHRDIHFLARASTTPRTRNAVTAHFKLGRGSWRGDEERSMFIYMDDGFPARQHKSSLWLDGENMTIFLLQTTPVSNHHPPQKRELPLIFN
jgi:hypothetical protein